MDDEKTPESNAWTPEIESTRFVKREWIALLLLLGLGLGLRMHHVNWPPVDFQSWRDGHTLMVARNFYREDMNLFQPRVDLRIAHRPVEDNRVGGSELMVAPWLTACLKKVAATGWFSVGFDPVTRITSEFSASR